MDIALEMFVKAVRAGAQPPEHTFVPASSRPALADLARKYA
jgi:hypothetical protein